MHSAFENIKKNWSVSIHAQALAIIIAFLVMGVSSFFFAKSIERRHLIKDVENVLAFSEADINSSFYEPETFLSGYSETIRRMILMGDTGDEVSSYMEDITYHFLKVSDYMSGLISTYGYFFNWGGKYISGINWTPGASYNPQETPWYNAAINAGGEITITEPYVDVRTGNTILTFSRCIMNEGSPLGVICIDVEFSRINKYAGTMNITRNSYGILMDSKFKILAHSEPYLIGEYLYSINSGIADLLDELEAKKNIYERRAKNFLGESTVVFFRNIRYGWYLGVVVPVGEYYKNIIYMALFLFVLSCLLSVAICIMLYKISLAKRKSDLRTQQKSNFLATMSHEIRTPLNAILGMTEIQMQNASHPPATSEAFMKINNSGNLLLNIVNDILDLSKIEAGKLELTPVKYEVASLINDIVQLNFIRYESKPVEFKLEIDENIPSILVGDEIRIKQVLNNLLSNAFKYTERGTVTLGVNAECVGRGGGAVLVTLIFQVSDTGQGMSPEQVRKLFDEYTRFNMEANRSTEGAGLGMTITSNLVDLMYGKISVKSVVGKGTTVTVRLPQKTDGGGIRGVLGKNLAENLSQFRISNVIKIKRALITHEHMPYGRVLIVDDVETNLYVAKGLMAPYGLKIDLATSGFEAIEKVKEGNIYDIMFMDHMMPKMDGIETTRLLRKMGYSYPIVALTANAISGQAEVFIQNGFDGFISKPIDIRQLNVSLNKFIRDKQPAEVVEAANREKAELDKKSDPSGHQNVDSQLAEIFARDAEKSAAVLDNILRNNFREESDMQMYIINVHAMKSALANIGKTELSAAALRLEQAGREKDINVIMSETQSFIDSLLSVIGEIKPKDEDTQVAEDTEEALVLLREKMIVIKDACMAFDKKTAKNTLSELREKTWSHNTKELLNKIAEHLLHSEFDSAASLADEQIAK